MFKTFSNPTYVLIFRKTRKYFVRQSSDYSIYMWMFPDTSANLIMHANFWSTLKLELSHIKTKVKTSKWTVQNRFCPTWWRGLLKYHQKIFSPNIFSIRLNIEPDMQLEPRTIFQGPPHRYRYSRDPQIQVFQGPPNRYRYFRDPHIQVYRCIKGGGTFFVPSHFLKRKGKK